jgi:hypothetical protein
VPTKWTKIDAAAAQKLTEATECPGVVYPIDISDVPSSLKAIRGIQSCFVTAYTSGVQADAGTLATGEIALVRRDGDIPKGYNYVIATSSGPERYFAGPFKLFDGHHMSTTDGVAVASLFGHSPWCTSETSGRTSG